MNSRPLAPQTSALPTAPYPERHYILTQVFVFCNRFKAFYHTLSKNINGKFKDMRIRRKRHLEERLKTLGDILISADLDIKDVRKAVKDKKYFEFSNMFQNSRPVNLEIGCGKGGFITECAKRFPDENFLAVELLENIIVMAAERAKAEKLSNIKFFNCGADYLARYIAPGSLNKIFLNFSPPYSGLRYENRRLTKDSLICDYTEFLRDGGEVLQKTDDKDFFLYSIDGFRRHGFSVTDMTEYIKYNPNENIMTEYEKKFAERGISVFAFKAKKL